MLQPLVTLAGTVNLSTIFNHGTVKTQPLIAAAPVVASAQQQLHATSSAVAGLPAKTWLGSVDHARASFGSSVTKLQDQLDSVGRITTVLPELVGAHGTKRYFVGLQNEAESRGLGGSPVRTRL